MVNIILFSSAACIGLASFRHLPRAVYFLIQIFIWKCFWTEFSVHANTMLGGKLFQLFITLKINK